MIQTPGNKFRFAIIVNRYSITYIFLREYLLVTLLMGFDWFGQLLDALATAKMNKPTLPENERAVMTAYASKIPVSYTHLTLPTILRV